MRTSWPASFSFWLLIWVRKYALTVVFQERTQRIFQENNTPYLVAVVSFVSTSWGRWIQLSRGIQWEQSLRSALFDVEQSTFKTLVDDNVVDKNNVASCISEGSTANAYDAKKLKNTVKKEKLYGRWFRWQLISSPNVCQEAIKQVVAHELECRWRVNMQSLGSTGWEVGVLGELFVK